MAQADLATLIQDLISGEDAKAEAAALAMAHTGEEVLPSLQEILHQEDAEARWWATRALAEVKSAGVVPLLLEALDDPHPAVRQCAALALNYAPHAEAIPRLSSLLMDSDRLLAHLAAGALAAIGADAVPALLEMLRHGPQAARLEAVRALAMIGDKRSIPDLLTALDEDSALLEYWADEGLQRMGVGMSFFKP